MRWARASACWVIVPAENRCPVGCTEHEHYGARLRAKGVAVAPSATPSRFHHGRRRKVEAPSWEKGIVTETRPDGSKMPMLDESLRPIHVKQYAEKRTEYDATRRRLAST